MGGEGQAVGGVPTAVAGYPRGQSISSLCCVSACPPPPHTRPALMATPPKPPQPPPKPVQPPPQTSTTPHPKPPQPPPKPVQPPPPPKPPQPPPQKKTTLLTSVSWFNTPPPHFAAPSAPRACRTLPRRRLGRRLEEVAKAVGGGYCRLQMRLGLALGVRGTVAWQRPGALEGGGGNFPPPFPMHPCTRPQGCAGGRPLPVPLPRTPSPSPNRAGHPPCPPTPPPQAMAVGAQRSNLMTVPTDCPQRDERLGWLGDVALSAETLSLNFAAGPLLRGFAETVAAALGPDGSLPDVVPRVRFGARPGDMSWTAAFAELVQVVWVLQRDVAWVRAMLPRLLAHVAELDARASRGLARIRGSYGDWCAPPRARGGGPGARPAVAFTAAFSYIRTVDQVAGLARVGGVPPSTPPLPPPSHEAGSVMGMQRVGEWGGG